MTRDSSTSATECKQTCCGDTSCMTWQFKSSMVSDASQCSWTQYDGQYSGGFPTGTVNGIAYNGAAYSLADAKVACATLVDSTTGLTGNCKFVTCNDPATQSCTLRASPNLTPVPTPNAAAGKPTAQSSDAYGSIGGARAVDGDTNQQWSGASCTHTGPI